MLSNSGGGIAVVVGAGVGVGGWVANTSGGEVSDSAVVLGATVVTMVSGIVVGCVVSLLVAQAVAVSAAMARTDTPRRCLIKLARAALMPSDDNAGRVGSQVRAGWGREGNQWQSLARPASRVAIQ